MEFFRATWHFRQQLEYSAGKLKEGKAEWVSEEEGAQDIEREGVYGT